MLNRLRSFSAGWLRRGAFEAEMAEEVRFHIDAYADDLIGAGVEPDEARRRARIAFGGAERVKEECRQACGLRWCDEIRLDVRYALRSMAKTPGFTAAAVFSVAL